LNHVHLYNTDVFLSCGIEGVKVFEFKNKELVFVEKLDKTFFNMDVNILEIKINTKAKAIYVLC